MSDENLVAVTMSKDAARAFFRALIWAAAHADEADRHEEYDWLAWGAGRVATAVPDVSQPKEPSDV